MNAVSPLHHNDSARTFICEANEVRVQQGFAKGGRRSISYERVGARTCAIFDIRIARVILLITNLHYLHGKWNTYFDIYNHRLYMEQCF